MLEGLRRRIEAVLTGDSTPRASLDVALDDQGLTLERRSSTEVGVLSVLRLQGSSLGAAGGGQGCFVVRFARPGDSESRQQLNRFWVYLPPKAAALEAAQILEQAITKRTPFSVLREGTELRVLTLKLIPLDDASRDLSPLPASDPEIAHARVLNAQDWMRRVGGR